MLILSRQYDDQSPLDVVGIYLQDFICKFHVEKWEIIGRNDQRCRRAI